jgi:transcriptional regulator with XRE-family HTH domain
MLSISNYSFLVNFKVMGFKENLKSELIYSGTLVKELSAKTGIKRHTLDNYLNTHNAIPNAEAAVKIAQALGVTVEYLITGQEEKQKITHQPLPPDLCLLVNLAEKLSPEGCKLAIKLIRTLKVQEDEGKKGLSLPHHHNTPRLQAPAQVDEPLIRGSPEVQVDVPQFPDKGAVRQHVHGQEEPPPVGIIRRQK